MLVLAHNSRFGKLRNELENSSTKGKNGYPESFHKIYSMLYYRVEETRKPYKQIEQKKTKEDGVVLNTCANDSDLGDDTEGELFITNEKKGKKQSQRKTTDLSKVQCYKCKKYGHYANTQIFPSMKRIKTITMALIPTTSGTRRKA